MPRRCLARSAGPAWATGAATNARAVATTRATRTAAKTTATGCAAAAVAAKVISTRAAVGHHVHTCAHRIGLTTRARARRASTGTHWAAITTAIATTVAACLALTGAACRLFCRRQMAAWLCAIGAAITSVHVATFATAIA